MKQNFTKPILKMVLGVIFYLLIPWSAFAQNKVSGTVVDNKNNPLPGVSVFEKGTKNGTTSNGDGKFSLTLTQTSATITFRMVGYLAKELPAAGKSVLNIKLEDDNQSLSEVVLIGYQTIERKKSSSAISSIKGKDFQNTPYASVDAMLQGRVAGLAVMSTTGEPGANNIVNIRGSSSVNLGGTSSPLYVIDNVVYDVNDMQSSAGSNPLAVINPNDIETIDVLKDASASAIYGSRAANGVIIVTTKRPKLGIPQIRLSSYYGMSGKPSLRSVITGASERRLKMDYLYGQGTYDRLQAGLSQILTDSLNVAFNNNTDWQGLFTQNAGIYNIDASVSAAEDKYSYKFAVNKYYEEGVYKGYDFDRLTPSLFLMVKPSKAISVNTNIIYGNSKAKHGMGTGAVSPFITWGFPSSFFKVRELEEQLYSGTYDELRDDDRNTSLVANVQLNATLAKNLLFTSNYSYNTQNNTRNYFMPGVLGDGISRAFTEILQSRTWETTNYLTYNFKVKEDHSFSALIGQGAERATRNNSFVQGRNITIAGVKTVQGLAPGADLSGNSYTGQRSKLSYFARLSYDYKSKYLLQASYRRDASSRYSVDNRWASFPSVSLGWVLSEEEFLKPMKDVVSFFKIRGSYGLTGQDPGDFYAQYTTLTSAADYDGSGLANGIAGDRGLQNITTYNGTQVAYPFYYGPAASSTIKWETNKQFNIGADISFFKDRIMLTGDYYVRDTYDQVLAIPVPVTTGYTTLLANIVSTRNTGVELTLNTRNLGPASKLQWSTNFNIAYNKNYVIKLPNNGREITYGPPWLQQSLSLGLPLFYYKAWEQTGVYATLADVPVDPLTGDRLKNGATNQFYGAGDPALKDMNGDYIINDSDKINSGSPNPKYTGGMTNTFSYKNFSLSVLTTFVAGRQLRNGYLSDLLQDAGTDDPYYRWGVSSGPATHLTEGKTFWSPTNTNAEVAGLVRNTVDKWNIGSSAFVQNASFIRVKSIQLSYSLPQSIVKKFKMQGFRIYSVADNLYLKKYADVPDPELIEATGYYNGNTYSLPKKITFGLEATF
ncbi:SusC/RagA family TonB-linked outer membrane protein [Pedobacter sp. MR2016-24]|uniref:SusC/RagA family TonB-linked outer membrane protein n=1 Tax=Pedobacter sp. MR2016-24 TaxID=2994466 RepID=UPI002245C1F0|nr:SusC/RagA family TonB-linked outer membrane protein [Pedobacter sp. MR2016-24]MCX2486359.1 SusC/RagA family TonB-linked outer membrane protein [Pedobacter sp. MR2016-24]